MKMKQMGVLGLAFLLGAAGVRAQEATTKDPSRISLDQVRKVTDLLDAHVVNQANQNIAEVEDLVLAPNGSVLFAILGRGGVAGIGEKYTAIPWDALSVRFVNGKWALDLPMTDQAIKNAPALKSDNYREFTDPQWIAGLRNYFRSRSPEAGQPAPASPAANPSPASQKVGEPVRWVLRATKILDATLQNAQNESPGALKDLILDRDGRVVFAILGRGGILEIGEDYVAIPWSKLRLKYNPDNTAVTATLDATKQQLERAPLVKGGSYATLLAPGFADGVYKYFNVNPAEGNPVSGTGAGTGAAPVPNPDASRKPEPPR